MGNPTATDATRATAGKLSKGKKGTARKDIAPATGFFALPPPKPEYYEENGLRKVAPYMYALASPPSLADSSLYSGLILRVAGSLSTAGRKNGGRNGL